jgi:hypothetical protein
LRIHILYSGSGKKGKIMEKLNYRVEDWLFNRTESEKTRNSYLVYINKLNEFCEERGKNLYEIVEEYRKSRRSGYQAELDFIESWQDLIRAYTTYIKKSSFAPLTQKHILSIAKSYFSTYKLPIDVDLPRKACVKYHNRDLTKQHIRKIISKAGQRDRTIFLLLAESGLRVKTAIHLKYWQIKEDYENGTVPLRIITPASEIKDHVGDRWSFIGEDGEKALREYLEQRTPLKDEDYIFISEKPGKTKGEQFTTANISTIFRYIVKDLKLENTNHIMHYGKPKHFRLHGLRKYFRNNMKADPSYREFWMAHSLGVDAHYVSRDPEFHRKEYKKNYEQLRILEPATPTQLIEIAEKLNQKDQEIQELKKQNKELYNKFEKLDETLKTLKAMEDPEFKQITKTEAKDPISTVAKVIKVEILKELKEEIKKMKKELSNNNL